MIRFELTCILDEADNEQDAAEVKWSLNNSIAAYNARLEVEERIREHHKWGAATAIAKNDTSLFINIVKLNVDSSYQKNKHIPWIVRIFL